MEKQEITRIKKDAKKVNIIIILTLLIIGTIILWNQ